MSPEGVGSPEETAGQPSLAVAAFRGRVEIEGLEAMCRVR